MSLRVGGIAAIVGALILAFAWFTTFPGLIPMDPIVLVTMFVVGLGALLVALTILSAFQARTLPVSSGPRLRWRPSARSCTASASSV